MILMTLYELHFKTSKEQDWSKVDLKTSCLCSDIAGVIFGFYREINLDQMFRIRNQWLRNPRPNIEQKSISGWE